MEIYLVRHTTPHIEKGICYGQSDVNLKDSYSEEFVKVEQQIPKSDSYHVISSPLKRCTLLARHFSKNIILKDALKELNFGKWELTPWNKIPENEISPWMSNFVNHPTPEGESYKAMANRVNNCLNKILDTPVNRPVIIVLHAGPIRAFLASLIHLDLKDSFNIKINYGDVFHIRKTNTITKLITPLNLKQPK